jgi:hypothetical protein
MVPIKYKKWILKLAIDGLTLHLLMVSPSLVGRSPAEGRDDS